MKKQDVQSRQEIKRIFLRLFLLFTLNRSLA